GAGLGGAGIAHVYALASYNNRLFVGGQFADAGGVLAQNLAAWSGGHWEAVGAGIPDGVSAFAEHQGRLFIAGSYGSEMLAVWDDTVDMSFVHGAFGFASCLLDLGDDLLVGGVFTARAPDSQFLSANLMRWEAGTWLPIETWDASMHGLLTQWGNPGSVRALATFKGNLVASGAFNIAGNPPSWKEVGYLAEWDGHEWSGLPPLPAFYAQVLLARDDTLYAGGTLNGIGSVPSPVGR